MSGVRNAGPTGRGPENPINDGTLVLASSAAPGTSGVLRPEADAWYESALRRLTQIDAVGELEELATALLGPSSFGVGVVVGMGEALVNTVGDLLKLASTMVLADFHDLQEAEMDWWDYVNPLKLSRLGIAAAASAALGESVLADAAAERDALVTEIGEALSDPRSFIEGATAAMIADYQKKWDRFKSGMAENTIEGRYEAGKVFGEVLLDLLSFIVPVQGLATGSAKLAARLPRISRLAKSVKVRLPKFDPQMWRKRVAAPIPESSTAAKAFSKGVPDNPPSPNPPLTKVKKRKTSKRRELLGATPGKKSKTGRAVIEAMRKEGKVYGEGDDMMVMASNGKWRPIAEMDMAHNRDMPAVTWWNKEGYKFGPRSPEVRKWMLDPKNYYLEDYRINRMEGGASKETYRAPIRNNESSRSR